MWIRWPAALFVVSLPATSPLAGQAVLSGTIRDDSTGRPLGGAEIVIDAIGRRVVSDPAGRYVLKDLPPGFRQVLVRLVGYHPSGAMVRLTGADTTRLDFALVESVIELEPIEVTAQAKAPRGIGREAFEERRQRGFGKFIDSTVLRRSEHRRLGDLLWALPGIFIDRRRPFNDWYAYNIRRYPLCPFLVYLDGVPFPDAPDLTMFDLASLESIEVYRSAAEVPIEFGGPRAACGVIALWSRRGS